MNDTVPAPPVDARTGEDCWNRIGVWGHAEPRCPRLAQAVHCRNCLVYTAAGQRLLDRPPPAGYTEGWTAALACTPQAAGGGTISVLVFRIGDEWLGVRTAMIREISPMRARRTIPHRASHVVCGLVNVRGELLLYASLGRLFGVSKGRHHEVEGIKKSFAERLVVIEQAGRRFVFPVSEVDGILHFPPEGLRDVPTTIAHGSRSLLLGIVTAGGRHIGYIDDVAMFAALERHLS